LVAELTEIRSIITPCELQLLPFGSDRVYEARKTVTRNWTQTAPSAWIFMFCCTKKPMTVLKCE